MVEEVRMLLIYKRRLNSWRLGRVSEGRVLCKIALCVVCSFAQGRLDFPLRFRRISIANAKRTRACLPRFYRILFHPPASPNCFLFQNCPAWSFLLKSLDRGIYK